jgi:N utilization substance protein B
VKTRRQARILALQILFEVDSANHPAELVLTQRLEERPMPEEGEAFLRQLVQGVLEHCRHLDSVIHELATDWPLEQMATIDRNVLRMAVYEILIDRQTPVKVAINEAVELAKMFGSESSRRFVNGVLGAVVSRGEMVAPQRSGVS